MLLIHSMNSRGSASSGTGPPAKTVLMIISTSQTNCIQIHLYTLPTPLYTYHTPSYTHHTKLSNTT